MVYNMTQFCSRSHLRWARKCKNGFCRIKLLCVRNAHMVHIVNYIRFKVEVSFHIKIEFVNNLPYRDREPTTNPSREEFIKIKSNLLFFTFF